MPTRRSRLPLAAACVLALAAAVLAPPTPLRAGDSKTEDRAKKPHLEFRPNYADALLEARIRNLPVFVSRHKDF